VLMRRLSRTAPNRAKNNAFTPLRPCAPAAAMAWTRRMKTFAPPKLFGWSAFDESRKHRCPQVLWTAARKVMIDNMRPITRKTGQKHRENSDARETA